MFFQLNFCIALEFFCALHSFLLYTKEPLWNEDSERQSPKTKKGKERWEKKEGSSETLKMPNLPNVGSMRSWNKTANTKCLVRSGSVALTPAHKVLWLAKRKAPAEEELGTTCMAPGQVPPSFPVCHHHPLWVLQVRGQVGIRPGESGKNQEPLKGRSGTDIPIGEEIRGVLRSAVGQDFVLFSLGEGEAGNLR